MDENEKKFINSVPESDPGYAVKRLQIKEWYKPFGKKVLNSEDLSYVAQKFNNFSDNEYWMNRHGDFVLDRASIMKRVLSLKTQDDNESLLDDYDRYQIACWLCSEKDVREIFTQLEKDADWSKEEYVTYILSKHCRLKAFWSHYINITDESSEYVTNPNTKILNNLEELIKKYNENYDKKLDYRNKIDLWKYGFECAKKEGCVEALKFFFNKLKEEIKESELDQILIDTALYATSSGSFNLRHSNANVIDFCLANLGADKHKVLLQKDYKARGFYSILDKLEDSYLFEYAKELIRRLEPKNISSEEYYVHFVFGIGNQVSSAPNKQLMKLGSDFLIWVWEGEDFLHHKKYCLDKLSKPGRNAGLTDMLSNLARTGAFEPLEKILDSASEVGCKKEIAKSFCNSYRTCCALYIQDKKDLLGKILGDTEYSNDFVKAIEVLEKDTNYKQKWDKACDLHKEFRIKESMTKILELLSDYGLGKAIDKKINELAQDNQAGGDVPSSLRDPKSAAYVQEKMSK